MHGHERLVLQIVQASDVRAIGTREDKCPEPRICTSHAAVTQGCDTGDAVAGFQHGVGRGIGQDKIELFLLDLVGNGIVGERNNLKNVTRNSLAEVVSRWSPHVVRLVRTAERQNADFHRRRLGATAWGHGEQQH